MTWFSPRKPRTDKPAPAPAPAPGSTPAPTQGPVLEAMEKRLLMAASKLRVLSASAPEGSAANPGVVAFTVKRLGDRTQKAKVRYRTIALQNGPAAVLGADLQAAFGKLVFKPGQKTKRIFVRLIGNSVQEPSKQFAIQLFKPKRTRIANAFAVGTIADDDGANPTLSINDIAVVEGNKGTKTVFFQVALSKASAQTVSVKYATKDGSATSKFNKLQNGPEDYIATNGTLTFAPGQTVKSIAVQVVGDTFPAQKLFETFFITLSNATNASIAKGTGTATIEDNDL